MDTTETQGALGPYLRAMSRHRLLVAAVTMAAVVGALLWLAVREPRYEASANLLVAPLPFGEDPYAGVQLIRDAGEPARTMQTAATLVRSPDAARAVTRVRPDLTPDQVLAAVKVEPLGESNILAVRAQDASPAAAAGLANAFARAALQVRAEANRADARRIVARLRDESARSASDESSPELADRIRRLRAVAAGEDPTLSLAQTASPSAAAVGPSRTLTLVLALLAGLTIGGVAAVLLQQLRHDGEVTRPAPRQPGSLVSSPDSVDVSVAAARGVPERQRGP
jgi:capsular polysaccharide biosynthesis protein